MIPVSPVVPGFREVKYAEGQEEYLTLPSVRALDNGRVRVVTRWRCEGGFLERLRFLFVGDIYISVLTFGKPLQPLLVETTPPDPTVLEYLGAEREP